MYSRIRTIGFAMAMLFFAASCTKEEIQPTEETNFTEFLENPETIKKTDTDLELIDDAEEEETETSIDIFEELETIKEKIPIIKDR